ncbi:hypothetical protein D8674_027518 [Pyrus ussuriensis x Pyrus communis]|uniref:Uncharacterized protein n=1 Tax=Pyrus ussuriensis x Pyrus communis TaxID=2448454 RepID=A0A5N5IPY3_9ROSA|nr:hypothetical protein D8674_027518 [Pyrus ussuriensis x Pyrus communis]
MSKPVDVSFFLLFLVLCRQAHEGRLLISDFNQSTSSNLIFDGVHHHHRSHAFVPYLTLNNSLSAEDSTCEQTYGFLPCTITVIDNLFLISMFSLEGFGDPCFKSLATPAGPLPWARLGSITSTCWTSPLGLSGPASLSGNSPWWNCSYL